ncbi:MAG TPA: hypothetical protein VLB75_05995 [Steroidobacteraceae bacterium]|nr:hypothetical protein [Steroidobacteraceae bacterium]
MRRLLSLLFLPARPTPLVLIVCFALGLTLAARAGLIGLPLALILLSWYFKYGYVVLDTTLRGFDEPPVLSVDMVNPASEQRPLGQLLIIGVFYAGTRAAEPLIGSAAVAILRLAALALLPACVAVLGVSRSVFEAVNPAVLLKTIRILGASYLLLVAATALPVAIAWLLFIRGTGSLELQLTVTLALVMFGGLAAFSVIGGVLYDKRVELGLDAWKSPERDQERRERETHKRHERVIDELYGHWRSGARTEARQAAEQWLTSRNHDVEEFDWLCERLLLWPDHRLAHRLAQQLITRLLAAKRAAEALKVARRHLGADADFRPALAAELVRLATYARDSGDRPLARRLLADFERHFPSDPAAPVARDLQQELMR